MTRAQHCNACKANFLVFPWLVGIIVNESWGAEWKSTSTMIEDNPKEIR